MPRTLNTSDMVTPGSLGPPPTEPTDGEPAGQSLLDGAPLSASLDTLIQHLVPTTDYYPEKAYIFTFLLSSRLFIEPQELLARVCHLCIEQQQLDQPVLDKARVQKFGPKLLQLLAEWTETFPRDFQEESTIGHLKDVMGRIAPCDEAYRKRMHQLLQALHQKLAAQGQGQGPEAVLGADKPISYRTKPPASIHRELLGICSDPYTLAQQLTHVELERLRHIGPEEFVQAFVNKDPLASTKPCFSEKTTNLEAYVKWFNRLCYLVATEICMPAKKKQRAQVVEFFIDVARECFNIGNFNSLMAIISGMNMSPVSRLKKTWAKVKTAKFFILEHQMDPTGNFCNYRTALRGAAHRSLTAHSSREKIVIPFFSLLIKDIYFLNEGCANRLPNGHVNFEKFLELAKQVGEFITWKQVECPFEQDPSITHYLHTAPIFSEDGLYLASYESESPENQTEKERWKSLSWRLPLWTVKMSVQALELPVCIFTPECETAPPVCAACKHS
ncbi:ras-GEF domain-containing family member 1C isoform X1 [Canis lupus familiaris]|nr:ras-GEF domain-containing family member 1C isoform X1 [Canis lupus dingo]XP_025302417.1 ras-GEF domain-containing family member 1C isoform X1 [Canis lupus dingo]XP_025302418.1 ras-GEF domain-containing family member 1C isoform X1 [Canis lupus dingo]XP_025302424.1 ras-GEF domain-containing family member 1C isoform X1 [Canis lupus dingo]XP_025302429.1 ras-GEF domain-containing family member 1C isoform X1 [Canis lupus dingo]XP_025302430.1 ras-GEF domain-containing family member 1C isoform X1 [